MPTLCLECWWKERGLGLTAFSVQRRPTQVHKARLRSDFDASSSSSSSARTRAEATAEEEAEGKAGRIVAVKVQFPDVERKMRADFRKCAPTEPTLVCSPVPGWLPLTRVLGPQPRGAGGVPRAD